MRKLCMKNDGTYEKKSYMRKYPVMIESVVDKSKFTPNVNDVRNLLTSDKIGSSNTQLYDFANGVDNGTNHYYMRGRPDITEMDAIINAQTEKSNKNIKEAIEKGEKQLEKQLKAKAEAVKAKTENGGET